jgi:3'(2'), 5'-bisphosphate nucleotidase
MQELPQVKETIKKAGAAAMEYYGEELKADTHYKDDDSPVTKADLAAQAVISNELQKFGYPMLSEEQADDESRLEQDRVWIVDPLDGTKDFLQQTGDFTVMIALAVKSKIKLGAVYAPATKTLYFATQGGGAYMQKKEDSPTPISVSSEDEPKHMNMLVSRNHLLEAEQRTAEKLGVGELVTCGSAGLKICKIAAGRAHMYINSSDKTDEWDIAAGEVILTEAGGELTDIKGNEFKYNNKDTKNRHGYLASNGVIHQKILETLQQEIE